MYERNDTNWKRFDEMCEMMPDGDKLLCSYHQHSDILVHAEYLKSQPRLIYGA